MVGHLLDRCHVLIKLDNEDDMLIIRPRGWWFVRGHWMKVFKWTPDFRPSDGEPSTAPVWISFPSLPVGCFEEHLLHPIAKLDGRVISMEAPTKKLSRTNVVRVCVEVDHLKEHPQRVWIGVENRGFWQAVKYERVPFPTVLIPDNKGIRWGSAKSRVTTWVLPPRVSLKIWRGRKSNLETNRQMLVSICMEQRGRERMVANSHLIILCFPSKISSVQKESDIML